ncbi:MAG: nucleotidyl transferase AbiEii/AbiGii toxin family protein [Patescibacteria group bacterium]
MLDLHLEVLRKPQRALWELFQGNPAVLRDHGFTLAGGTALALQIGHRESQDFDFFSQERGIEPVRTWLERLPGFLSREMDADTVHGELGGVKVSFIAGYRYPPVMPPVAAGALSLTHIEDIALMKMMALTHRAALRDYIDLAAIMRSRKTLSSLLGKSREKFGDRFNVALALRAMVHFGDLDGEMPVLLDAALASSWQDILRNAVKEAA